MIIDCIADLHGHYPKLEGGDLLIVAGDITGADREAEWIEFNEWLCKQTYRKIVWIGGNHDNLLEDFERCREVFQLRKLPEHSAEIEYLMDSGTEFEGLKIWGSPWTLKFPRMNPRCIAFTCDSEEQLAEKWAKIPEDTDILVTHGPPYGSFDREINGTRVGSVSLEKQVRCMTNLKLHAFGHIHEGFGSAQSDLPADFMLMKWNPAKIWRVNCSHVNEFYYPEYPPVRIELESREQPT